MWFCVWTLGTKTVLFSGSALFRPVCVRVREAHSDVLVKTATVWSLSCFCSRLQLYESKQSLRGSEINHFFPYLYANLPPGFRIQSDYVLWMENTHLWGRGRKGTTCSASETTEGSGRFINVCLTRISRFPLKLLLLFLLLSSIPEQIFPFFPLGWSCPEWFWAEEETPRTGKWDGKWRKGKRAGGRKRKARKSRRRHREDGR